MTNLVFLQKDNQFLNIIHFCIVYCTVCTFLIVLPLYAMKPLEWGKVGEWSLAANKPLE